MGNSRASRLHALLLPAPEQVQVERRQKIKTGGSSDQPWLLARGASGGTFLFSLM